MAKKKKKGRKRGRRYKKQIKFELLGLLFIFLAIFGSGAGAISDGVIPNGLENIFRFFLGIWYFVASVALLFIGIVLLVKRRFPHFNSKKMIGFYIGFLGLLLLTHIQTFERLLLITEKPSIMRMTWDNYLSYLGNQVSASQLGGGLIGGLLFTFSYFLFSAVGTKIVSVFSILIGFLFMTEFSLGDIFGKLWEKIQAFYQFCKDKFSALKIRNEKDDEVPIETSNHIQENSDVEPEIEEFTEIAYSFEQAIDEQSNVNASEQANSGEEDDDPIIQDRKSVV